MKVNIYGKLRHSSRIHELIWIIKEQFHHDLNCIWNNCPPDADDDWEYELLVEVSEVSIEGLRSGEDRYSGSCEGEDDVGLEERLRSCLGTRRSRSTVRKLKRLKESSDGSICESGRILGESIERLLNALDATDEKLDELRDENRRGSQ